MKLKKKKKIFGTKEWAVKNINFINGCKHNCKYCYSKEMAIRFNRKTPENWEIEVVRSKDVEKKYSKYDGRVMFPSSHDITPDHLRDALIVLKKLLEAGNEVLIVTKPHLICIDTLCKTFKKFRRQILFRFTIGSSVSSVLKFWEPNAPSFEERLDCLKKAHKLGFETSVSCEPMLDSKVDKLIDVIIPFVSNSIWIGKANFLHKRMKTNGVKDKLSYKKAKELEDWQENKDNILKLYEKYKDNPKIKWKESIKKVLGIEIATDDGMDV
jgi:DNA repair photolyase